MYKKKIGRQMSIVNFRLHCSHAEFNPLLLEDMCHTLHLWPQTCVHTYSNKVTWVIMTTGCSCHYSGKVLSLSSLSLTLCRSLIRISFIHFLPAQHSLHDPESSHSMSSFSKTGNQMAQQSRRTKK